MRKVLSRKIFLIMFLAALSVVGLSPGINRKPILVTSGTVSTGRGYRWGLEVIGALKAWKVTRGSPSITVAVIDGGIDFDIPALQRHRWTNENEVPNNGRDDDNNGYVDDEHGWDFRNKRPVSSSRTNTYFHGTFVGGLITSAYRPESGTGGVAPRVKLMDLRVLNSRGRAFPSDWSKFAAAVRYAVSNGAKIINLSLSARRRPPELVREAIEDATREGVLVVVGSGNGDKVQALARLDGVTTAAAVSKDLSVASFSASGPEVDISAPGEKVLSFKEGRPVTGSGTSFAAAHVSGAAALLFSERPRANAKELIEILLDTAKDLSSPGKDFSTGRGLVNVDEALQRLTSNS